MLKVILCVGIPACGKSTWSKEEVRKDPEGTTRINRDDLRNMLSNYHFTDSNEKIVTSLKEQALIIALKAGRNIIIDETNLNRRNFDDVCDIVRSLNIDCMVMEKPFYVELDEAIARDNARTGSAHVSEEVVKRFWKKSGGTQHKYYKPRVEMIVRKTEADLINSKPQFKANLPEAIVCDLDGTLALFNAINRDGSTNYEHTNTHARSPYDAANCDKDSLNEQVAIVLEAMHKNGHKIIFCSGREDVYRTQTENFIKKYLDFDYKLYMRKSGDIRKDTVIKEEIYNNHIFDKYNVFLVLDDRTSVINFWRSKGLTAWQVNPGDF
jgi:predicted kinase